jgi:hypothetical protein
VRQTRQPPKLDAPRKNSHGPKAHPLQQGYGMSRLVLCVSALVVTACSHGDDKHLTASEHRELAELHEARADAERAQFDPSQTRETVTRSPFVDLPDSVGAPYNPTAEHLASADRELRRAAQHSRAAEKLEAFEAAACRAVPKEQRLACPLLASQVASVQNDQKGVQLVIKDGADAAQIEQRLQCHLAYAQTTGFDRPACPLFVQGLKIERAGPNVIAFHGDTAEVARQLQQQARRIFVGEQPVSRRD